MSVGDFGGGVGFLASALAELYKKVVSYDIAEYAGKYGRKHFPKVMFITKGIEPDAVVDEGPFDMALAYEFYPFTRTDEYGYGKSYIDTLLENVKNGGFLVVGLPDGKERKNLYRNWSRIKSDYCEYHPAIIQMPYSKIMKMTNCIWIQQSLSKIFGLFKERHLIIVFSKI